MSDFCKSSHKYTFVEALNVVELTFVYALVTLSVRNIQ